MRPTTYIQFVAETRRLTILRLLSEMAGATANSALIERGLTQMGFHDSRDTIHADLDHLRERGAVDVAQTGPVRVVTLRDLGSRAARGLEVIDGVAAPSLR
jgi:uncharacterized protein with GYD domain